MSVLLFKLFETLPKVTKKTPCHGYVTPLSHLCHTHVTPTSHPSLVSHPISHPCHTHITLMPHPCQIHVTPMPHPCHTHVKPMSNPFNTQVVPMPPCCRKRSTPASDIQTRSATVVHYCPLSKSETKCSVGTFLCGKLVFIK